MIQLDLPDHAVPDRFSLVKVLPSNVRVNVANLEGCGCINHIWVAPWRKKTAGMEAILRIYFDGVDIPFVEAPIGDFFGIMHGESFYPINTEYFSAIEESGYNSYVKMPFADGARIEIETGDTPAPLYIMVDWHYYPKREMPEKLRFCARWRHENPTRSYSGDYLMLDADGPGRLLGFFYGVRLHDNEDRWSHGGAENIYIDGEENHPSYLRGIGGEDSFGASYGGASHKPETRLYSGMPYYMHADVGEARPAQRLTGYRFFDSENISFSRSVHMRFGSMRNEICSTVYWYSRSPVRPFYELPPATMIKLDAPTVGRDLDLPDYGNWHLCGPFPQTDEFPDIDCIIKDHQQNAFDKTYHIDSDYSFGENAKKEAFWIKAPAFHNFIDFRHYFRVRKRGVSPTEPGCAVAICTLKVPDDTEADILVSWDDSLTLICNEDKFALGNHNAFRSEKLSVNLRRGRNSIALVLTNTIAYNHGGWAFSFRAVTKNNREIIPELF